MRGRRTGLDNGRMDAPSREPPANIYEGNGQLSVALPIPGAHREHTRVLVTPEHLSVEAECKYPQEQQRYLRRDWQVGSWSLDLDLPRRVDPVRAHAKLSLGVLVVMAPLSETGEGRGQPAVE